MATIDGDHSKSGVVRAAKASTALSLKASIACVAISTGRLVLAKVGYFHHQSGAS